MTLLINFVRQLPPLWLRETKKCLLSRFHFENCKKTAINRFYVRDSSKLYLWLKRLLKVSAFFLFDECFIWGNKLFLFVVYCVIWTHFLFTESISFHLWIFWCSLDGRVSKPNVQETKVVLSTEMGRLPKLKFERWRHQGYSPRKHSRL